MGGTGTGGKIRNRNSVPVGRFIRVKNDKGKTEVVRVIRIESNEVEIWGKPGFMMLEIERANGKRTYMLQLRTTRFRVVDPPRKKRIN